MTKIGAAGGSKSRTINISPRIFDRFVQNFAYIPYMALRIYLIMCKLKLAQKRRGSKIRDRGHVYGKVMWMATPTYFEFIFGHCPI